MYKSLQFFLIKKELMERTSPSLNSKKIVSRFRICPAIVLSMEETGWISKAAAENRAKGKGGGGGS